MSRRIPGYADTYDPDTMKLLVRAFDAAWVEVRRDKASAQAEDRRTRLALIILGAGRRDEAEIKQRAVKYINSIELPNASPVRH